MSKSSESKPPPSLRNLVSQLVDRATQRRQRRSEISREVRNEQLKRCATVLCSEACQDFAVEELNIWFQVAKQKGTHELKALLYLVDLILSRHVREVKKRKDDAALEKVAKGCIGENGQFLALRLLEYVEHKMCSRKNWRECKDFIKDLAYKWESYGFFRSPLVKKAVCQILWDLGAHDHMNPETQISKQRTRPPGDIMVPKLPHFDRDRTHFFESLLCSDADRQERYEAFVRAMHADNEKESERARAMEKRRCERLGRKPRSPEEIQALQEELREKLETELAKWPGRPMKSSSGAEKLKPKVKPVERTLGQKVEPYAAEFHFLAANFPERAEPQSGEAAKSLAPREPAEKPASARVSGTQKVAEAAKSPAEKPASARVSGAQKVAEAAKSPAPREPAEKPASARVSGTQKVAEAAKSPAPREPAEKPASARVSESAASSRGVKRPAESETDASEKRSRTSDDSKAPAPTNVPRKIKWKGGSLKVWPVLGDHRCLFRAVVRGVFDRYNKVPRDDRGVPLDQFTAAMETRKADIVRKALCDYMQLNKARVEPCMEPPGSDATQYIQSMRDPTTWADQICTKFLPEVIKCPIHVQAWNHKKKCLYDVGVHLPSQGMDTKRGAVFLYYNGRAHYELVCLQHLLKKERALQNQTVSSSSSYEYDSSSSE